MPADPHSGSRLRDAGYRVAGELGQTDRIMSDAFWVGVYPGLSEEMIGFMFEQLLAACRL